MVGPQLISMEGEDFPDYSGDGTQVVEGIQTGLQAVGDIFGGASKRKAARRKRAQAKGSAIIRALMERVEAKRRGEPVPAGPVVVPEVAPGAHIVPRLMQMTRGVQPGMVPAPQIIQAPAKPLIDPSLMLPIGIGAAALLLMLAKK